MKYLIRIENSNCCVEYDIPKCDFEFIYHNSSEKLISEFMVEYAKCKIMQHNDKYALSLLDDDYIYDCVISIGVYFDYE